MIIQRDEGAYMIFHVIFIDNSYLYRLYCFSSSRSIKRRRFDDELVEYSLGLKDTTSTAQKVRFISTIYI